MNTRLVINEAPKPIALSASFNQDSSSFSVGLDTGFCIFDAASGKLQEARDFNAGIGNVEMIDRTQYVALVGGGKNPKYPQNKVIIWDEEKRKIAIALELATSVLRVRLSRARIVVALQNSIHIYKLDTPPNKLSEFETADNSSGLCCLGPKVVAFPGQTAGRVQLVELTTGNISIIPAHNSPLRAMDLSAKGDLLATASDKGTLIRVFSTTNSTKLAELRRGLDQATIFSMKFSPDGTKLAATSDKSTLHIFDLPFANQTPASDDPEDSGTATAGTWGLLSKIPFLPKAFSDTYSFASAHFDSDDDPNTGPETRYSKAFEPIPGLPRGRAPKGIIGWINDEMIVVIGAGRDGRWERYRLKTDENGKKVCESDAWKRYLED